MPSILLLPTRIEINYQLIPWERLEAIPWTRFSLEAQKQIERDACPRIGPLGTVRQVETPTDDRCLTICEERLAAKDFPYNLHD